MVVKVYISGISGNKEVKKRQQRVLMILDSKHIKYDVIDITEPGRESDKEFMQTNSKSNGGTVSDPNPRSPLPPQVFNEDEYCGDYDQFDMANEVDTLEQFLKVEIPPENVAIAENGEIDKPLNGDVSSQKHNISKENSQERQTESVEKEKSPPTEGDIDDSEVETEAIKETVSEVETAQPEDTETAMDTEEQESKENTPPKEHNSDITDMDNVTESKLTPSETLIESEQTAASD